MVEIYNENIQDLLTSDARVLDLKAQGNKIVLPGLTEMVVDNKDDIDTVFSMGDKNRHVASTKMNSTRYGKIGEYLVKNHYKPEKG